MLSREAHMSACDLLSIYRLPIRLLMRGLLNRVVSSRLYSFIAGVFKNWVFFLTVLFSTIMAASATANAYWTGSGNNGCGR